MIVSAALRSDGKPSEAISLAATSGVLAMSPTVFDEIVEVLSRPKFRTLIGSARRGEILDTFRASTVWVVPKEPVADCRDAKDNKYLELALAADATAILSSDADLLVRDPLRHVRIMAPVPFLAWISPGGAATSG